MRERFRGIIVDVVFCLIVAGLQVELWLTRRPGATAAVVSLTVACAALLVVFTGVRVVARQRATTKTQADAIAEADRAARCAERDQILARHREAAERGIHAVIVEIVAAHQGVVRAAFPDDILMRLRAADDGAHEAVEALRQLAGDQALESEVVAADEASPEPVAADTLAA